MISFTFLPTAFRSSRPPENTTSTAKTPTSSMASILMYATSDRQNMNMARVLRLLRFEKTTKKKNAKAASIMKGRSMSACVLDHMKSGGISAIMSAATDAMCLFSNSAPARRKTPTIDSAPAKSSSEYAVPVPMPNTANAAAMNTDQPTGSW
ncbi:Uncharacterised protein [uncultured archaeon]|nr:Uncharacterised protein [uncultured archaeon]